MFNAFHFNHHQQGKEIVARRARRSRRLKKKVRRGYSSAGRRETSARLKTSVGATRCFVRSWPFLTTGRRY